MRTLLILIDGTRSVTRLQSAAATLGAPADLLASPLVQDPVAAAAGRHMPPGQGQCLAATVEVAWPTTLQGVEVAAADPRPGTEGRRVEAAEAYMTDTVVDVLGRRAGFFMLTLERCFARADLEALSPKYITAIARGNDESAARWLASPARAQLR